MDHFRLRKYRGPEVWARVREAYVAGEPGPQVARRYDVGLANLRKKALREGWTRRGAARAGDPLILATQPSVLGAPAPGPAPEPSDSPADPGEAFEAALSRAAAAIAAGRGAEAQGLLRAAETLARLRQESPPDYLPTPQEWAEQEAARDAAWARERADWRAAETRRLQAWAEGRAMAMARALLSEKGWDYADDFALTALHWRAEHLGPEQALADFHRGVTGGWAARYWTADGRPKPVPVPAAPSDHMWRQHLRSTGGLGENGEPAQWPPAWAEAGVETPAEKADRTAAAQAISPEPERGPMVRRL
jgi:hypothetical protein